jgi:hypothetical protein
MLTINTHRRRTAIGRTAVALVVAVTAFSLGAPRAEAIDSTTIILGAVQAAYGAYGDFQNDQDLQDATRRIINAVNSARDEILAELNTIAESEATSCAETKINQFASVDLYHPITAEIFALEADGCLTTIKNFIRDLSQPKSVDKLGYALNALGPIVLAAYAHAGFPDDHVITTLRDGNNRIRTRLEPSVTNPTYPFGRCWPTYLRGDAEPGAPVEVHLTCKSYNGDQGKTFTWSNRTFDYTAAKTMATRRTSRPVAIAALALL